LESDGSLRFFWLDYLKHEGKLYFIGILKDKASGVWKCAFGGADVPKDASWLKIVYGFDGSFLFFLTNHCCSLI